MAQSYHIIKASRFRNSGYNTEFQTQLTIDNDIGISEGEGRTSLVRIDDLIIDDKIFNRYQTHFDLKKMAQGRVFEREFTYYFEPHDFESYFNESDGIFIISAKKDVSINLMKELNHLSPIDGRVKPYKLETIPVNFQEVISRSSDVSGVWAKVDRTNVETQAFFGTNVNDDPEVKAIIDRGHTSYVQISITYTDIEHKIGITKEGNIVFFTTPPSTHDLINIIYYVYERLLS